MRLQEKSCGYGNSESMRFPQNAEMDVDWIRKQLTKPGKSQAGLARALGLNPSQVNRLLKGERLIKLNEVETIRAYLGVKQERPGSKMTMGEMPQPVHTLPHGGQDDLLKVVGMAEGGEDGWQLFNGEEIIEYIQRPENLRGVPGAYGVYIRGHSMEPRYEPGMIVHVHPGRPVLPGSYVLVQRHNPDDENRPYAVIKRLVRRAGGKVTLAQLNPAKTFDVKDGEIVSIHRVVGSSEA